MHWLEEMRAYGRNSFICYVGNICSLLAALIAFRGPAKPNELIFETWLHAVVAGFGSLCWSLRALTDANDANGRRDRLSRNITLHLMPTMLSCLPGVLLLHAPILVAHVAAFIRMTSKSQGFEWDLNYYGIRASTPIDLLGFIIITISTIVTAFSLTWLLKKYMPGAHLLF